MLKLYTKKNNIDSLDTSKESIFNNKNILNVNSLKLSKIRNLNNKSFDFLYVSFSNDFNQNCNLIKKLNSISELNINFSSKFHKCNLDNCLPDIKVDIEKALKAISIKDYRQRITYLYDEIFDYLDSLWKKNNPCNFCNDRCIASIKGKTAHQENGCCYSFNCSKNPFKLTENEKVCKYLGPDKACKTQNLSCKLFVCRYLRKNNLFNINLDNIFLIKSFFSKNKILVLKENFFVSKEKLIGKLLEDDDYIPYFIYYLNDYYRIID